MSDDLTHFKPLDPGRVNVIDPVELAYWCRELHCNETELAQAVATVGEHIAPVREFLGLRH
jgi:hypothetical protein